ncbi:E3 ubiquitin-protein ligase EL5-like [Panicum miliaceum]|uniref:E3 ubiquitin-protein ligase EL5-like n=1 Tax=Panicum miliaceum TaxID=4540 RepID=A0A3L6RUI9_PANMI|nr:E3 ubiquitin-protein ligase EL5-like [Panicum miliaceum]
MAGLTRPVVFTTAGILLYLALQLGVAIWALFCACHSRRVAAEHAQEGGGGGGDGLTPEEVGELPCHEFKEERAAAGECTVCLEAFRAGDRCRVLPSAEVRARVPRGVRGLVAAQEPPVHLLTWKTVLLRRGPVRRRRDVNGAPRRHRGAAVPGYVAARPDSERIGAGDRCRVLPRCGHGFHAGCVDSWLRKSRQLPVCRAEAVDQRKDAGAVAEAATTVEVVTVKVNGNSAYLIEYVICLM